MVRTVLERLGLAREADPAPEREETAPETPADIEQRFADIWQGIGGLSTIFTLMDNRIQSLERALHSLQNDLLIIRPPRSRSRWQFWK